jgi:large conductance mechanosensitive channel
VKGFRDFLMRGNLVELAVAVIMGTAFAAVVKAFTGMILDLVGKFGGKADFSSTSLYGISVGVFITALLSFVLTSAVVYWLVVIPYNSISARLKKQDQTESAPAVTSEDLLTEIRDLLRQQATGSPVPVPGQAPQR